MKMEGLQTHIHLPIIKQNCLLIFRTYYGYRSQEGFHSRLRPEYKVVHKQPGLHQPCKEVTYLYIYFIYREILYKCNKESKYFPKIYSIKINSISKSVSLINSNSISLYFFGSIHHIA